MCLKLIFYTDLFAYQRKRTLQYTSCIRGEGVCILQSFISIS